MIKSAAAMTLANVAKASATLFVTIYLARFLDPTHYGSVTLAITLMTLISLASDVGLGSAVVRNTTLQLCDLTAVNTLVSLLGAVSASIVFWFVLYWSSSPEWQPLRSTGGTFSVAALFLVCSSVLRASLERTLSFATISGIELISVIFGISAFLLTLEGLDPIHALGSFYLCSAISRFFLFKIKSPLRRLFTFSITPAFLIARQGLSVFAANLFSYAGRNADKLIIGSSFGPAALGVYGLAYQVMTVPLVLISWPLSGVLLAYLSRSISDSNSFSNLVSSALFVVALLIFPFCTFIYASSELISLHIFGGRWSDLQWVLEFLMPLSAVQSLAALNGSVLISQGRFRLNLLLGIANGTITTLAFIVGSHLSFQGFVIVYAITNSIICLTLLGLTFSAARVNMKRIAAGLIPAIFCASSVLLACFIVGVFTDTVGMRRLLYQLFLSVLCFGITCLLFRRTLLNHANVLKG